MIRQKILPIEFCLAYSRIPIPFRCFFFGNSTEIAQKQLWFSGSITTFPRHEKHPDGAVLTTNAKETWP